uniref:Uncharacterized protein n=1 Tax=Octopus bimaculoides TaxID=37653 RepID=A0A0L8HUT0_OCTBM
MVVVVVMVAVVVLLLLLLVLVVGMVLTQKTCLITMLFNPRYYRGAVGALVVYDITKPASFSNLEKWLGELHEHADQDVCLMVVGNKTDLHHLRAVTLDEGRLLAEKHNFSFIETSALDATNVGEAFNNLLVDIFKVQVESKPAEDKSISKNSKSLEFTEQNNSGCGC